MSTDRPTPKLSDREHQLLKLAAEGFTDTAIAHRLGISEATVGTYWGRVRIKLGPYSRTELVAIILRAERDAEVQALKTEIADLVTQLKDQPKQIGQSFALLDNAPDAMLLVTPGGKIEYANFCAQELFGYSSNELKGHDLLDLIPGRYHQIHLRHKEEYLKESRRRPMGEHAETPALHRDGTEFPIRAALSTIDGPEGPLVMCMIRPLKSGI